MKSLIVIPARFASTRFPGKPLAKLSGKPIIQWVWENAVSAANCPVIIATDDDRIAQTAKSFGAIAVMTSEKHQSGTDRVKEAMEKFMPDCEAVLNLQGDEPFVPPELIKKILKKLQKIPQNQIISVAVKSERAKIADNPNIVKVVINKKNYALYFSRLPIPYLRDNSDDFGLHRHWGIYAFRRKAIEKFASLHPSPLEKAEKLEQLRALENGMKIYMILTDKQSIGIDTPQDLEEAEKFLSSQL